MRRFVVLEKKIGETPLAAVRAWKEENPAYAHEAASYAGRLDPMASGSLLVLLGEECKRQREYTNLDKEYEIEVLLDVGSDTGDVLGIVEYVGSETRVDENALAAALASERGAHSRAYPAFSSKIVNGKPLFLHALEGALPDIVVPEHVEHIYRIQYQGSYTISSSELEARITALLDLVPRTDEPSKRLGEDFRIGAVRAGWQELFKTTGKRDFTVLRLRVTCASGVYMRSLAGRLGTALGTSALALSIRRTKIGKYLPLFDGIGFWTEDMK